MTPGARCDAAFVRRVLIVVAIGGMALLLWHLVEVLLLGFGAVLVAVLGRSSSTSLSSRSRAI
jgi:hypothetical protein